MLYILKIKGAAKIPDYVQLRDEQFTLIAYFRVDRPEKALIKCGLSNREAELLKIINEMPFGKVQALDFKNHTVTVTIRTIYYHKDVNQQ
jgi:hypothetical protein